MKNVIDRIDTLKANSVSDAMFKATWGVSLDEHMKRMMEYVRKTDERIALERRSDQQSN